MRKGSIRKRFGRTVLVGAALTIVLVGTLSLATSREPRYQGRSLSSWLEEINRAGSVSNAVPALLAVEAMGTNALPFLCRNVRLANSARLNAGISAFAERFEFLGRHFSFVFSLYDPTCLAFRALGTNASPVIPQLGELLLEPAHTDAAKLALCAIGPSAAQAFERGCNSPNLHIRTESALYLAKVQLDRANFWTSWSADRYGRSRLTLSTGITSEDIERVFAQLKHPNPAIRHASKEALKLQKGAAKSLVSILEASVSGNERARIDLTNHSEPFEPFPLIPNQ